MSKYDPLKAYLNARGGVDVPMSFADIEAVLGFRLPNSARNHRHWWGNNAFGHAQSRSWMGARYKVARIDVSARTVVFANFEHGPDRLDSGQEWRLRRGAPSRAARSAPAAA